MLIIISQHKLLQQTCRMALEGERGEKRELHSEETISLRKSPDCEAPRASSAPWGGVKDFNGQAFSVETSVFGAQTERDERGGKPARGQVRPERGEMQS